jgi:hypothetical protein
MIIDAWWASANVGVGHPMIEAAMVRAGMALVFVRLQPGLRG